MKFWLLLLVVMAQIGILAGEYLGAVYPLWVGKEIKLKTVPIDPRSLFRGNYTRLRYDISRVKSAQSLRHLRKNEVVYVGLIADEQGIYKADKIHLQPPTGVFIRGRLIHAYPDQNKKYPVRYGIEAYFTKKDKALALEHDLQQGGIALVMVTDEGKATLKTIQANNDD